MSILKGYKTTIVAVAAFLLMIMDFVSPDIITDALGLESQGKAIVVMALPIIMQVLRVITTSPIGKKL